MNPPGTRVRDCTRTEGTESQVEAVDSPLMRATTSDAPNHVWAQVTPQHKSRKHFVQSQSLLSSSLQVRVTICVSRLLCHSKI